VLRLTDKGRCLLAGNEKFMAIKPAVKLSPRPTAVWAEDYNRDLFEKLRRLRRKLAAKRKMPPFIIFSDRTLHEMARHFPSTLDEMRAVNGVGDVKLREYGMFFLTVIRGFIETHPEEANKIKVRDI
jgi:ATP-dependent DNA helicase RecQ